MNFFNTAIIALPLFTAPASHGQTYEERTAYSIVLPGGETASFRLNHLDLNGLRLHYESGLFSSARSLNRQATRLLRLIGDARSHYLDLKSTGLLPRCSPNLPPTVQLTLLRTLDSTIRALDPLLPRNRFGFSHPLNPGPIIQAWPWDETSIAHVAIHEVLHFWCESNRTTGQRRPLLNRWREEGAADYLAFLTTGSAPYEGLRRYFSNPKENALYGSSFLWWLAQSRENPLRSLAELHLGNEAHLFQGRLALTSPEEVDDGRGRPFFPYGQLVRQRPLLNRAHPSIPLPALLPVHSYGVWSEISTLEEANQFFVWRGPSFTPEP